MKSGYSKILIITDNQYLYEKFREITSGLNFAQTSFTFKFSYNNRCFLEKYADRLEFGPINVKKEIRVIVKDFDLVISAHAKQIFPAEMVSSIKCINIHPGYNPYNRGWYPQVFGIINKLPLGVTIHEIDEQIDHGAIIDQVIVPVHSWDTSLSVYNRILDAEMDLVKINLKNIIDNSYQAKKMAGEGNLNLKKDFENICILNLKETASFKVFIDRLRALTHGNYKNAYFIDPQSGRKIFVSINLEPEEK